MSQHVKVISTVAVVCGAALLLYSSISGAEKHYQFVQEVLPDAAAWEGKVFKVHGIVEAGSILEEVRGQKMYREFILEAKCEGDPKNPPPPCPKGKELRLLIKSTGPKPDTFKELAEVIATGTLTKDGELYVFQATELSAKCPSKYENTDRPSEYGQPS